MIKGTSQENFAKNPGELENTPKHETLHIINDELDALDKALVHDQHLQSMNAELLRLASNSLMIVKVIIASINIRVFIVSGDEVNHISLRLYQRNKISTTTENGIWLCPTELSRKTLKIPSLYLKLHGENAVRS